MMGNGLDFSSASSSSALEDFSIPRQLPDAGSCAASPTPPAPGVTWKKSGALLDALPVGSWAEVQTGGRQDAPCSILASSTVPVPPIPVNSIPSVYAAGTDIRTRGTLVALPDATGSQEQSDTTKELCDRRDH